MYIHIHIDIYIYMGDAPQTRGQTKENQKTKHKLKCYGRFFWSPTS